MESPRDTKTDHLESSVEKHAKIAELELELHRSHGENQRLKDENDSLRTILQDYEHMKTNEATLLDRIDTLEIKLSTFKPASKSSTCTQTCDSMHYELYQSFSQNFEPEKTNLESENTSLKRDLKRLQIDSEMSSAHLETKIRLLKEALNKRNEDIKEIELSNTELIEVLAKCDEKLVKLDEGKFSTNFITF